MLKLTLLCLFVIQILSIQAKTNGEVIEDMQPLIQHFHNTISIYESAAHGAERITMHNMSKYLFNAWYEIQKKADNFPTTIKSESMLIVTELGMTSHMDKIQHCFTDTNTKSSRVQITISAGADVCRESGSKNLIYAIDSILKPLYEKLYSLHTAVENVKVTCSNSQDAMQALICITDTLYRKLDPEIQNMEDETSAATSSMTNRINHVTNSLNACNEFVVQKLNEQKPILDDFRKCVQEVANNQ